ncbi:hypothetical protein GW16_14930 [Xanthomonas arboricola pv. celebensis]|nr:hypothetical protein GW16_14930 [Xanthomonas arboricola pv. celebensis]
MDETGEILLPLGSAFFIAPFIALTARHVIDEISERFHGCKIHEISGDMRFGIDLAIQHPKHGLMKWAVMAYGYTSTIDVAALIVELRAPERLPEGFEWHTPSLSFKQAALEERIVALGYPQSSHRLHDVRGAKICTNPRESQGVISQVHDLIRDSSMMPYPCYETNARIEGGMSGAPVFSRQGHVIGVVDSSFELGNDTLDALSYVSAIWPCAGIELHQTAFTLTAAPAPYYLQALVDNGTVSAVDRQTSVDLEGKVTLHIRG